MKKPTKISIIKNYNLSKITGYKEDSLYYLLTLFLKNSNLNTQQCTENKDYFIEYFNNFLEQRKIDKNIRRSINNISEKININNIDDNLAKYSIINQLDNLTSGQLEKMSNDTNISIFMLNSLKRGFYKTTIEIKNKIEEYLNKKG